jgi:hypothetical protein
VTGRNRHTPDTLYPLTSPAKEQASMKQPQEDDPRNPQRTRPPEYVIVTWVSAELRDRIQRNNAAQVRARQNLGKRVHGRKAEPEAEREAEP